MTLPLQEIFKPLDGQPSKLCPALEATIGLGTLDETLDISSANPILTVPRSNPFQCLWCPHGPSMEPPQTTYLYATSASGPTSCLSPRCSSRTSTNSTVRKLVSCDVFSTPPSVLPLGSTCQLLVETKATRLAPLPSSLPLSYLPISLQKPRKM